MSVHEYARREESRIRLIEEEHLNATEGYMLCDASRIALKDTWMGEDATSGDIFRASRSEFGRCVSKVYIDTEDGPKAIGWVFLKRDRYEDTDEPFLHETWITLLERHEVKVERDYASV